MILLRTMLGLALILPVGPALSQTQTDGQLSDQDRSLPIEIEADVLTLEQDNSLAIFEGHVLAVQGDLSLKADELRVYYVTGNSDTGQSIRLIEAEGHVVIASPRETATGANGVYDVEGETMQLTGDVILTRDENVLEGDVLDIDLARNVHRLKSDADNSGGRIKALFSSSQTTEGNGS